MSLISNFDTDNNFWDVNPSFKIIGPFKEIRKWDRTKGKTDSSKILWAICFLLDPSKNNPYRNLDYDDKKNLLAKDFLKEPDFDWEKPMIADVINFYRDNLITQSQKSLYNIEKRLKDIDELLVNLPLDLGNAEVILDLIGKLPKLYEHIDKLKRVVEMEEESNNKKSKPQSFTDQGLL